MNKTKKILIFSTVCGILIMGIGKTPNNAGHDVKGKVNKMNASEAKKLIEAKKYIITVFGKIYAEGGAAIRTEAFFEKAKAAGIYNGGYGEPINRALVELTEVEAVHTPEGEFAYHIFKLKGI